MAKNEFYQKKNHTVAIWSAALILLIILLITLFWLAPKIWNATDPNSHIIPLFYEGDNQIVDQGTLKYIAVKENPGMITEDKNVQWEIQTDVDLFKTEYLGPDGSVTVQSSNGDKLIAPGTSHDYAFSLKNTGNISIDYTMELDSLFTLENHNLPIKVRLRKGDNWIVGGYDTWEDPDDLNNILETGTLGVGGVAQYIFEWLWPYEDGIDDVLLLNDMNDVIAANAAVEQNVVFQLEIITTSEVTPGAVPSDANGIPLTTPLVRWNLFTHVVLPGVGIGFIIWLILLFRRPVYVTGFAVALPGTELKIGRKKDTVRADGRFVFKKIYTGKHKLVLGQDTSYVKIKRTRKVDGLGFEEKDKCQILLIHPATRAVEIYLTSDASGVSVSRSQWATIDKKNRVYTPSGMIEPVDKCNSTPHGLTVDKKGSLDIPLSGVME